MNQTSFCLNSKFHKTFKIIQHQQQLSSSIHQWHIHHTNSSTTCFQTLSTQLFMNSFQVHQTTTSLFIIFHKNTTYSYI